METLLEILTQYAEENLLVRYLREYTPQIKAMRFQADQVTEVLKELNPETAERIDRLKNELDKVYSCREQAFLLSGISIGLELGRL